ncbi:hypothetical protein Krac_6750 [Ktedonobacter racemifer DSM 44963]|uniref:Uncharacterized protein n=1 Tax=Ktedonobacter racemifer DSM 44963 TaxID=485913 RepID=D6TNZ2_KTERA|nr:hypothetical protein Krac_6750 [Ktedonobacter racemifer DSM 44963]
MTCLYAVFSSHALLPSPFRGSSLSARISEVRRRSSNNLHNFCCAHILPPIRRTGARPVGVIPLPCVSNRWLPFAFGILRDPNTCVFRPPHRTSRTSMGLFLQRFLVALDQALPDSQTGIAVGMVAHLALWAQAKRRAGRVSLNRLALIVANDGRVTAMALPARIARIDAARDETTCIPRLVLRVLEDAPCASSRRVSCCCGAHTCLFAGAGCLDARRPVCLLADRWRTGQCGRSPGARCAHRRA